LYHCDVSILPSHQENFGISVVESLACGRPVLISDQVNIWREIKSAEAALVQPDTPAGTAELLAAWLRLSPADKSAMAARAKPCFEKYFSLSSATQNLIASLERFP
jgi:glycosyltransferase involved in cell wall biosynthesis